jgi:two-component system NarL family sensor kinase
MVVAAGPHRRIAVREGVILALVVAGAAILSDHSDWDPWWLPFAIAAVALAIDVLTLELGHVRVSPAELGVFLALFLCGPLPAVLVLVVMNAADVVRADTPLHAALTNCAGYGVGVLAAALVLDAVDPETGTLAYGALLVGCTLLVDLIAFANLAAAMSAVGTAPATLVRRSLLPVAPSETVLAFLAAGTVLLVDAVGYGVLAGVALLVFFLGLMVRGVARAEQRALEIDRLLKDVIEAEERERRRVAAELHDDALQTLLAARSDIVEGLQGDAEALASAHDSVAETVRKLRELMARMTTPAAAETPVGQAVAEIAASVERRTGAAGRVDVAPELAAEPDGLVVAIARELLVNVAKHARATRFEVRLARTDPSRVTLEVLDDGIGMANVNRTELQRDGHLGLRLLEERVAARDGELRFDARAGGGTRVVVNLRG